ncbi:MAG TPA: molecular chaperone TorD family protein [Dehalococcoidia bacterium]|nr:molecular chaperone TorD family protein [Dehalococcoidia bacterium]
MTSEPAVRIDEATSARSELYGLLADALSFPERAFHVRVTAGAFRDDVEGLVEALPYSLPAAVDFDGLAEGGEYVDFQAEYIRLFEVGAIRPPCPLYGGEWGPARKRTMEEVLRFYRFFGLKVDERARELPDHVSIELEFLQVLAFEEGMARATGVDTGSLLRAQRDFLERHPARWWRLLERKLATQQPARFYAALASLTGAFLAGDLAYVQRLLDEG